MSEPTPNFFSNLGKPVKDEYGRIIGTMASFLITPGGRVDGIFVEHRNGVIKQYSSDQVNTEEDSVVLRSPLKMMADNCCNQIPLLWRKTQALRHLNEQEKIPREMYDEIYPTFDGALKQLKAEAEHMITDVENELENCVKNVKALNSALINLEIEREIGQIDEQSYQTAIEMVREGLKGLNKEKEDFEALRSKLSNMCLDETPKEAYDEETEKEAALPSPPSNEPLGTSLPEPPETSPENPVVVYVKNAESPTG